MSLQQLEKLQVVDIDRVIDGDSVRLTSGEQVRLIGINAPEITDGQPLSGKAKSRLQSLLSQKPVYLQSGEQQKDRYGRLLGHLFLPNGRNIEEILLREGYGFLLAFPPNLSMVECHKVARDDAKSKGRGIWSVDKIVLASNITSADVGFQLVKGRLISVSESKSAWLLQLNGDIVLSIQKKHWQYFDLAALKKQIGKTLLATGWVIDRTQRATGKYSSYVLDIKHHYHLSF